MTLAVEELSDRADDLGRLPEVLAPLTRIAFSAGRMLQDYVERIYAPTRRLT
jgi:hypothetical protein